MHDLPQVPERVRSVIEEYCRRKCSEAEAAAYARGVAAGKEEILAVLKAVSAFQPVAVVGQPGGVGQYANQPNVYAPVTPSPVALPQVTANPVVVTEVTKVETVKAPIPEALLSRPVAAIIADMEDGEELGTAGFRDALDDLFGDERWGDLDRQELVRYVMLMVQEELTERGVDPSPVLSMVRTLGECGGGQPFEATLLSLTDPTLLSWQAVPLRNPRGNFRFAAENLETGQKRYGEKAIAHMQHANRDRHEFAEGERQPYDLKGERTLMEHTEAFRKAKDSLSELVESLRAGESVRPGDLADFQDRIGLLPVSDLRTLRKQLSNSLTGRVKAGKTKADRVAGIQESLGRLVEAATAITKAALERAEMDGATVHPPDELLETLFEGEILVGEPLPDEIHLSVAANTPKPPQKVEPPKPAGPKAGAYQASPPTPAPPKPPEQKKPATPPKPPAYSDYGVGGQKMEGARTPGAPTVAEVQAKSAEKASANAVIPSPTSPPKTAPVGTTSRARPLDKPVESGEVLEAGKSGRGLNYLSFPRDEAAPVGDGEFLDPAAVNKEFRTDDLPVPATQSVSPLSPADVDSGDEAWKKSADVQGLLKYYRDTGNAAILPVLADAYEEAGAPAEVLASLRESPESVDPNSWFLSEPQTDVDAAQAEIERLWGNDEVTPAAPTSRRPIRVAGWGA